MRQAGLALLVGWPGETALQRAVAGALFHTMVQRRSMAAQLAGIDAWRQLAGRMRSLQSTIRLILAVRCCLSQALATLAHAFTPLA